MLLSIHTLYTDKGRSGDPAASRRTLALGVAASASATPVAYMGNLLFKQGFTDPVQNLRHTRVRYDRLTGHTSYGLTRGAL